MNVSILESMNHYSIPKKQGKAPNYQEFLAKYPAPQISCDEAEFMRTINEHQMTILRDEGVNRHLRFAQPNTGNRWFELLTWPGKLCISGDIGTFVFTRLSDMFEFFRVKPNGDDTKLHINPSYWGEKCCAADRNGNNHGMWKWEAETFKNRIAQWLVEAKVSQAVLDAAEADVINTADDGEHFAVQAVMDFSVTNDGRHKIARTREDHRQVFTFQDFWEVDCTEYTYHFLWCLYAIAWGIRQYDQAKQEIRSNQ